MKCPKCGMPLMKDKVHNFCPYCGYLDDGKQIKMIVDPKETDLELLLGNDFHKITTNSTWLSCLLLGPLYFCLRGFLFLGVFLMPIEWLFWVFIISLGDVSVSIFLFFFAFCFTRLIFMTFSNMICIFFYERKIKKIKKQFPDCYREKLEEMDCSGDLGNFILIVIIALIIIGLYLYLYTSIS